MIMLSCVLRRPGLPANCRSHTLHEITQPLYMTAPGAKPGEGMDLPVNSTGNSAFSIDRDFSDQVFCRVFLLSDISAIVESLKNIAGFQDFIYVFVLAL